MFPDPEALRLVVDFLEDKKLPYMVIGGLANAVWGEPRLTRDADFKVSIGELALADFRRMVFERFPERQTAIPAHKRSPQVVHAWARPNVPVDFLVSVFDYERMAIERATEALVQGVEARLCTAEDFVVHKAIANREQDWIDVERVLLKQKAKLDREYVLKWLKEFSEALEEPSILGRYLDLEQERHDPRARE
ncbi:MAG TPA: nucleotidyltransferase [Anaerolineales bacterium]|nr:nucleotidyltransferase [Anaerolineales bacterium]